MLKIFYPYDANCPEERTGDDQRCPVQDHSLGVASHYSVIYQLSEDGRHVVMVSAGRQTTIIANEGAELLGICNGMQEDIHHSGISVGIGRLIKLP